MEIVSEAGRGSIFRLRLPLAGGSANAEQPGVTATPAGARKRSTMSRPNRHPNCSRTRATGPTHGCRRYSIACGSGPHGLAWSEAQRRLSRFGPNETVSRRVPNWPKLIWHAANNPFNGVLVLLGLVSLLTDDLSAAVIMTVMVAVSTGLRFWQERKSLIQAESLRKLVRNKVTVVRSGNEVYALRQPSPLNFTASDILLEQLVPGDIVLLSAGDMVPGDLRLLESRDLFATQSALTGEAMPVEKSADGRDDAGNDSSSAEMSLLDRPNLLFMGSSVISGTGKAVVLATGQHTYFGAMASKLIDQRTHTAFDRGVNRVSWLLIRFMMVMVPIVFFINGLSKGQWTDAFFFAVAVAVGLTPEMLPMIVNANLARGALTMSRQKCIVKQLNAIQNLGAMDILCTDKTGTLTQDHVVLMQHMDLHGQNSRRVLEHAYLNSLFQTGLKNLLDLAVVERGVADGLLARSREIVQEDRRDPIRFCQTPKCVRSCVQQASGVRSSLFCKGAVEEMAGDLFASREMKDV